MPFIFRKTNKSLVELMAPRGIVNFAGPAGLEDNQDTLDELLSSFSYEEFPCSFIRENGVVLFQSIDPRPSIKITGDSIIDDFYQQVDLLHKNGSWQGWKYRSIYTCELSRCFLIILSQENLDYISVNDVHEVFMRVDQCVLIYP